MDEKIKKEIELIKNHVIRIRKSHTTRTGTILKKGELAWIHEGDVGVGILEANEIAIKFSKEGPVVGVDKTLVEPFTEDPITLYNKATAWTKAETKLRNIEQNYKDMGTTALASAINGLRKCLYFYIMEHQFGWDYTECTDGFENNERELMKICKVPYEINVNTKTVN